MIEILKHGRPELKPSKIKTFDCPTCTCVFKCDNEHYYRHLQYNETTYTAKCPECGTRASERVMRGEE